MEILLVKLGLRKTCTGTGTYSKLILFCVLYLGNSLSHFLQYLLLKGLQVGVTS